MQASQNWRWVFDPEQEAFYVDLDHGLVHHCPYKKSRLVPLHAMNATFSVEDATLFQEMYDLLMALDLWEPMKVSQIALNRTILERFGRPQMPQSWYFQVQAGELPYPLEVGALVELNSGHTNAAFVVTQLDEEFAECMLVEDAMPLSEIKTLQAFDVVRVLHNRLLPSRYLTAEQDPSDLHRRQA